MLPRTLPGLTFPNVKDASLAWIWRDSPGFNHFRGDSWMKEPCRSCPEKTKDFGGCRCQAYLLTGDAANADPVCDLSPHHHLVTEMVEQASAPTPPLPSSRSRCCFATGRTPARSRAGQGTPAPPRRRCGLGEPARAAYAPRARYAVPRPLARPRLRSSRPAERREINLPIATSSDSAIPSEIAGPTASRAARRLHFGDEREKKLHYAWVVLGVTFVCLLISAATRATPSILIVPLEKEFGVVAHDHLHGDLPQHPALRADWPVRGRLHQSLRPTARNGAVRRSDRPRHAGHRNDETPVATLRTLGRARRCWHWDHRHRPRRNRRPTLVLPSSWAGVGITDGQRRDRTTRFPAFSGEVSSRPRLAMGGRRDGHTGVADGARSPSPHARPPREKGLLPLGQPEGVPSQPLRAEPVCCRHFGAGGWPVAERNSGFSPAASSSAAPAPTA